MHKIDMTIPMLMALDDCFATVSFQGKPTLALHTSILEIMKNNCVIGNSYKEAALDLSDEQFAHLKDCVNTVVNTKIPGKLALGYSALIAVVEANPAEDHEGMPA